MWRLYDYDRLCACLCIFICAYVCDCITTCVRIGDCVSANVCAHAYVFIVSSMYELSLCVEHYICARVCVLVYDICYVCWRVCECIHVFIRVCLKSVRNTNMYVCFISTQGVYAYLSVAL